MIETTFNKLSELNKRFEPFVNKSVDAAVMGVNKYMKKNLNELSDKLTKKLKTLEDDVKLNFQNFIEVKDEIEIIKPKLDIPDYEAQFKVMVENIRSEMSTESSRLENIIKQSNEKMDQMMLKIEEDSLNMQKRIQKSTVE